MMGRALLAGINAYPRAERLRGCLNDVAAMRAYLTERRGLTEGTIKVLLDAEATTKAIEDGLAWLKEGDAGPRLFYYAGHGVQMADDNDDEDDGEDECLAPFDFDATARTSVLRDDRFGELLAPFGAETPLLAVVDACHSGDLQKDAKRDIVYRFTAIAGEAPRIRVRRARTALAMAAKVDRAIRAREGELGRALSNEESRAVEGGIRPARVARPHVVLLSACAAHERAADARIQGEYRGAFTYSLLKALAQGVTRYDTLVERVTSALFDDEYIQTPQLDCVDERRGASFLGG